MRVFKYRGGEFERDLISLEKNYFFAPKFEDLNDPCETLINTSGFKAQLKIVSKFLSNRKADQFNDIESSFNELNDVKKRSIGIYSLSKTFNDELLWAHYSDGHKGFCIEYDLELLKNSYQSFENFSFPVIYKKKPPAFGIQDIGINKSQLVVQKLAGYKSKRWGYEEEHRLVTGFYGKQSYFPDALKSIYFGLNMSAIEKETMMIRLSGRNIQFFQIVQRSNSYDFKAIMVNDLKNEKHTYLKEIPNQKTTSDPVKFSVDIIIYNNRKGHAEVTLSSIANNIYLDSIARLLKEEIFINAKNVFVSFILSENLKGNGYWAVSKILDGILETKINGLTEDQEISLKSVLRKQKKNVIGKWIDRTPFNSSAIIILQNDNGFLLVSD